MMESEYATWTTGAIALSTCWIVWRFVIRPKLEAKKPFPELPTPPGSHWLLGHLPLFRKIMPKVRPGEIFQHCNEYGQVGIWLGGVPILILYHVEDARAVLTAEHHVKFSPVSKRHAIKAFGSRTLTVMRGKEWKQHRDAIYRSMTPTALAAAKEGMVTMTEVLVKVLKKRIQNEESNSGFTIMQVERLMKMVTMDVFFRTAFSKNLTCCENLEASPVAVAFEFLMSDAARRASKPFSIFNWFYSLPTELNRQNAHARDLVQSYIRGMVEQRKKDKMGGKPTPEDALSFVMDVSKEDDMESTLSNVAIQSILTGLVLAGHETTSITLTYALYLLSQFPEVQRICLEEINRVDAIEKLDSHDLVYCNVVVLETLRMYPPGAVATREMHKSVQLRGGFTIPKGTVVFVNLEHIQRQERHFSNPDDFSPERWVSRKDGVWVEDIKKGTNAQAFLAFSAGVRNCAGKAFAMQEAVLVMAVLLRELKFDTISEDYEVKPIRAGITQHPEDELPMKISIRQ